MNQEKRKQITVYDLLLPSIKDTEARKLALSKYECVLSTQKEQRIFVALAKFQSTLSMAMHFKLDIDRYNVVLNEFDKLTPYAKVKVLESWLSHSDKLSESALQCEDGLYQLLNEMFDVMFEQTEFFTSEAAEHAKKFAYDHGVDCSWPSAESADFIHRLIHARDEAEANLMCNAEYFKRMGILIEQAQQNKDTEDPVRIPIIVTTDTTGKVCLSYPSEQVTSLGGMADVLMQDRGIESAYAKDPEVFLDADIVGHSDLWYYHDAVRKYKAKNGLTPEQVTSLGEMADVTKSNKALSDRLKENEAEERAKKFAYDHAKLAQLIFERHARGVNRIYASLPLKLSIIHNDKFIHDHYVDSASARTANVLTQDRGIESAYAKDPEAFFDVDIAGHPTLWCYHYAHLNNICKMDGAKPEYRALLDIHKFLTTIDLTVAGKMSKAVDLYNSFTREDKLIALKSYNARVIRSQPRREAFCRAVETTQEYVEQKMEDADMNKANNYEDFANNYEDFSDYEIKLLGISLMDSDTYSKATSESPYSCYCDLESHIIWALDRLHKLVEKVITGELRNQSKVVAAKALTAIVSSYDQMPEYTRKAVVLNWWSLMHLYASEAKVEVVMQIELFAKSVNVAYEMEQLARGDDTCEQDHLSECLEENEKPCHCHSNEEAGCGEKCECEKEESARSIGEQLVSAAKRRSVNMSLVVKGIAYVYMHIDTMPLKLVETANDLDCTLSNSHDEINNIGQNIFFQIALLGTLLCLSEGDE